MKTDDLDMLDILINSYYHDYQIKGNEYNNLHKKKVGDDGYLNVFELDENILAIKYGINLSRNMHKTFIELLFSLQKEVRKNLLNIDINAFVFYKQCVFEYQSNIYYNNNLIRHTFGMFDLKLGEIFDQFERSNPALMQLLDKKGVKRDFSQKIRWLGSPAQFGFIMQELRNNGFIEYPMSNNVESNAKMAKVCMQYFEIRANGNIANEGYLANQLGEENALSAFNRGQFKFPMRKDIS